MFSYQKSSDALKSLEHELRLLELLNSEETSEIRHLDILKDVIALIKTQISANAMKAGYKPDDFDCAARDAILQGRIDLVQFFLNRGVCPNAHVHGDRLTRFAAQAGHLDIVQLLVARGADIRPRNAWYNTGDDGPIYAAVDAGHLDVVAFLLAQGSCVPSSCLSEKLIKIHSKPDMELTETEKNLRIIELLLQSGANITPAFSSIFEVHNKNSIAYASRMRRDFQIGSRRDKVLMAFGIYQNNPFFDEIEQSLTNLAQLSAEDIVKMVQPIFEKLLSYLHNNPNHFTSSEIKKRLDRLISELKAYDQEKLALEIKMAELTRIYECAIKTLLDYAAGTDFSNKPTMFGNEERLLDCLQAFNIAEFNLVGISIAGQPITREQLLNMGIKGADTALVCYHDLLNLQNAQRREALLGRLDKRMQEQGSLISSIGIVNLTPLFCAVNSGDIEAVATRLKAGVNPNIIDNNSDLTAIELAAQNGHFEIVTMLAEYSKIDKKCFKKAIDIARKKGHNEIATYLFENQDVNEIDQNGNSLLHMAVKENDVNRVDFLIGKGANVNLENKEGKTPLLIATCIHPDFFYISDDNLERNAAIVRLLLENGADANQCSIITPLIQAVKQGNIESVALLLPVTDKKDLIRTKWDNDSEKMKEISRDPWYVDMLFVAVRTKSKIQLLTLLKANGADFSAKSIDGDTLLHCAIQQLPSLDVISDRVQSTLRNGGDRDGCTRLQVEKRAKKLSMESQNAFKKAFELLSFLLDNGANINLGGRNERTPLHNLIRDERLEHIKDGYKQLLELFIQHGANVNAKTVNGITPLHEAAKTGSRNAIKFLIRHGAEVDAVTCKKSHTPLHEAAARGFANTCMLLIKLGANVKALDKRGLTPLELCRAISKSNEKYENTRRILSQHESRQHLPDISISQRFFSSSVRDDEITSNQVKKGDQGYAASSS